MRKFNSILSLILVITVLISSSSVNVMAAEKGAEASIGEEKALKVESVEKGGNTTTYHYEDGRCKVEYFAGNIRYKDDSGKWKEYDNSLKESSRVGYCLEVSGSDKETVFPDNISAKTPVITSLGKYSVKISPEQEMAKQKKSENKGIMESLSGEKREKTISVDYKDEVSGTIYNYQPTNDGVKEIITLAKKQDSNEFSFIVSAKNCELIPLRELQKDKPKFENEFQSVAGEDVLLYNKSEEKIVGKLPGGYAEDANGKKTTNCIYKVEKIGEVYRVIVKVSKKYLESAAYPVKIDPTVIWSGSDPDEINTAYVSAKYPSRTYTTSNGTIMCVGQREDSTDKCRSYVGFEDLNSIVQRRYVESATLTLHTVSSSTSKKVNIAQISSAWNNSVTYSNRPSNDGILGDFTTSSSSQTITVNLDVDKINSNIHAKKNITGLEFYAANEGQAGNVWIYNSNSTNGTNMPKLSIVYGNAIPTISYSIRYSTSNTDITNREGSCEESNENPIKYLNVTVDDRLNQTSVKYRVYNSTNGWSNWISQGNYAGFSSGSIQAIEAKAYNGSAESTKYDVFYQTYVTRTGESSTWLGWAQNGAPSGNMTGSNYIKRVRFLLVPKVSIGVQSTFAENGTLSSETKSVSEKEFTNSIKEARTIRDLWIKFIDSNLSRTMLSTTFYRKNGSTVTRNAVSGTTANTSTLSTMSPVCGYSVLPKSYLADIYKIIHTGKLSIASTTQAFKDNGNISGSSSSTGHLQLVSARLVPKSYKNGKAACISDRLIPEQDGFCFGNAADDYGLLSTDPQHSEEVDNFYAQYGISVNNSVSFGGRCFGVSLASVLFKLGYLDINDFIEPIDGNDVDCVSGFYAPKAKNSNSKLKRLIDYLFAMQYVGASNFGEVYNEGREYTTAARGAYIKNKLLTMTTPQYIMLIGEGVDNPGGHVVTPAGIDSVPNTLDYTLTLYDCDYPNEKTMGAILYVNNRSTRIIPKASTDNSQPCDLIDVNEFINCNNVVKNGQARNLFDDICTELGVTNNRTNIVSQ